MSSKPAQLLAVFSFLVLVACSRSDTEAVSESQAPAQQSAPADAMRDLASDAAAAGDPTILDPDHYTTEFENEVVRIVRIKYGPGEESVMHYHPESVAVFVTDIQVEMMMADGSFSEGSRAAGEAAYNPAVAHLPRNNSDSPWEVVEVELKERGSATTETGGPDPTVVDAGHYTTEFENDSVRIVRIRYGAGEESIIHYHPDSVAVFVTDHLVEMTMPDGSTAEISAAAGDALFIPAGQHLPKNISDAAWELVLIELKG